MRTINILILVGIFLAMTGIVGASYVMDYIPTFPDLNRNVEVYENGQRFYQDHLDIHTNAMGAQISIDKGSWQSFNGKTYSGGYCTGWHTVDVRAAGYKPYSMDFYCHWLYVSHYIELEAME